MLTVIRHGTTDSNGVGEKEKLRGWLPIPLNLQGMQEVHDIAEALEDCIGDISSINSGVHPRHVQTAHEIGREICMMIDPAEEFNDLHTGDFQGQSITPELIKKIHEYYDNPDRKIPGGESVKNWISRYMFRATPLVEDTQKMHILITSGRSGNLMLAAAENGGGYPDMDMMKKRPMIENGGAFILDPKWKVIFKTPKAQKQAS